MKRPRGWNWIPWGLLVISVGFVIAADSKLETGTRESLAVATTSDVKSPSNRDPGSNVPGSHNAQRGGDTSDIAFQGRFVDDDGLPLTGTPDLRFRIFDDLDVQRYASGPVGVTLINGVATTQVPNVPQDVFNRFAPYRLEVSVDDPAFTSPFSVDLGVSPFAIRALTAIDAHTIDGLHTTDFAAVVHAHAGEDITSGTVAEAFIDATMARDGEVNTAIQDHAGMADIHHVRYTDAEAVAAVNAGGTALPAGVIVMWFGSLVDIPDGWVLCDGNNETPNLQDRFVVGAGTSYAVEDTGGEKEHVLTVLEIPPHHHTYQHHPTEFFSGSTETGAKGGLQNFDTGDTGGGQAHENRPPYFALAFIMRQ